MVTESGLLMLRGCERQLNANYVHRGTLMLEVPRQPPWICVYGAGSLSSTVNQAAEKADGALKELGLLPCVSLFSL